jgi:hypothetical protein
MSTTSKQHFDIYRKRTNPTLRLATKPGDRLPRQFPAKDWTLMKGPCVLHTDVSNDVRIKGYCYFQVLKG